MGATEGFLAASAFEQFHGDAIELLLRIVHRGQHRYLCVGPNPRASGLHQLRVAPHAGLDYPANYRLQTRDFQPRVADGSSRVGVWCSHQRQGTEVLVDECYLHKIAPSCSVRTSQTK